MMRRALTGLILVAGLAVGCTGGATVGDSLRYSHDATHGVGCWGWTASNANISCLPDTQYKP